MYVCIYIYIYTDGNINIYIYIYIYTISHMHVTSSKSKNRVSYTFEFRISGMLHFVDCHRTGPSGAAVFLSETLCSRDRTLCLLHDIP